MNMVMEEEEMVVEIVYCYCCEDFTPHELYDGTDNNIIYVCDCGCMLDDNEDDIITPGYSTTTTVS